MAIHYPPAFINAYLAEKVPAELGPGRFSGDTPDGKMKFFPASPTDIEALTSTFPDAAGEVFAVYDRMLKMRRGPFPHIKFEQLLYYFYKMAGDPVDLIESTQIVQDLLDREDESAQELNSWISNLPLLTNPDTGENVWQPLNTTGTFDAKYVSYLPVFFHKVKIYQLEETRDLIDFGTARTYAGNKIIIDYEWHKS